MPFLKSENFKISPFPTKSIIFSGVIFPLFHSCRQSKFGLTQPKIKNSTVRLSFRISEIVRLSEIRIYALKYTNVTFDTF